jgi:Tfp pilus assembly protein PilF
MPEYAVEIREYLSRTIRIDAANPVDAERKARSLYKNEDVVLGPEDYLDTEIETL